MNMRRISKRNRRRRKKKQKAMKERARAARTKALRDQVRHLARKVTSKSRTGEAGILAEKDPPAFAWDGRMSHSGQYFSVAGHHKRLDELNQLDCHWILERVWTPKNPKSGLELLADCAS